MLVLSSYRKSLISLYLAYSLSLALALSYPGEKQSLLLHALSWGTTSDKEFLLFFLRASAFNGERPINIVVAFLSLTIVAIIYQVLLCLRQICVPKALWDQTNINMERSEFGAHRGLLHREARRTRGRGSCPPKPWIPKGFCVFMLSRFSHVRLCDLMDSSPPGSSVHGISQARTLERVATPSSWGSSWARDQTRVSCVFCVGRQILYHRTTGEHSFFGHATRHAES